LQAYLVNVRFLMYSAFEWSEYAAGGGVGFMTASASAIL
jgi:hypothetical protein